MSAWMEAGREPDLGDIFEEPIVRSLMESDHTDRRAIEALLRRMLPGEIPAEVAA